MTLVNDGRARNSKNSKKVRIIKCKYCKEEYEYSDIKEDIYSLGGTDFIQCQCGEQTRLK